MAAKLVRFSEKGNMMGDENTILVPQGMTHAGDDSLPACILKNHKRINDREFFWPKSCRFPIFLPTFAAIINDRPLSAFKNQFKFYYDKEITSQQSVAAVGPRFERCRLHGQRAEVP